METVKQETFTGCAMCGGNAGVDSTPAGQPFIETHAARKGFPPTRYAICGACLSEVVSGQVSTASVLDATEGV